MLVGAVVGAGATNVGVRARGTGSNQGSSWPEVVVLGGREGGKFVTATGFC